LPKKSGSAPVQETTDEDQYHVTLKLARFDVPDYDFERYEARLRALTQGLVRRNSRITEMVADELTRLGVIEAHGLDELVAGRARSTVENDAS